MSSFRVIDPFAYFDEALAIGGSAEFYEAGTTTPADVFADPDLTVNNGSTVSVGTDGRLTKETWGDAAKSYRVRVYKQDGTLIRDRDNIGVSGAGGLAIPSLVPGQFLTNNGTALDWAAIRQLLDPTGANGKTIVSNGTAWVFTPMPSDGSAGDNAAVTVTSDLVTIGDGSETQDLFAVQFGSDTVPASGTTSASKAVVFGTAFKAIKYVGIINTTNGVSTVGFAAVPSAQNKTTTGFTAGFQVPAHQGGSGSDANIVNNIPFDWFALGTIAP